MKRAYVYTFLLIAMALLFSGCAPRMGRTEGVESEDIKPTPKGSVTAVDNSKRVLIVSDQGKSCLELSADAIVSTTNSSQSDIGANVNIQNALTAGFQAYAANTAVGLTAQVFAPTQGMQFYRTGVFALCEAMKNGFVTKEEAYLDHLVQLSALSEKLINSELDVRRSSIEAIAKNSPTEAVASTLTNLTALTQTPSLKVSNDPNESGNVTSDDLSQIDCGSQCVTLNPGSQPITLTARANPGFSFSG